ncbi:hypothetical protein [Streptacidiphilus sp. P02-A3a]|uniref:hypothetical protein n=1 Tax=Streptacidiphilus sp. P02-A3a TaxID=2704468 RepID=UPI0015FB745D|nr:hypothetical protein [Streptacidiphilus sp. P02-A3a]QMU67108.1 hypothetical protein GXP74_01665 [Streptacidiphilus sp. P02-A3a]
MTIAIIFLIASLQFGIICQKFFYSQEELKNWWTDLEFASRLTLFSEEQKANFDSWQKYGWLALACYNTGVAVLAASLATLLSPLPSEHGAVAYTKSASALLMAAGAIAVVVYGVVTVFQVKKMGNSS